MYLTSSAHWYCSSKFVQMATKGNHFFRSRSAKIKPKSSAHWYCSFKYVQILFCTFLPNFMMMTSSIQKLWTFCQLVLLFYRNLQKKETVAVLLKRIDQLPQNLTRVHNLVGSFKRSYTNFKFFRSSYCFHCFYCFSIVCLSFAPNLILH